jgi:S-adenosylmethionine:tRNA ribosyltransferase-isomerase
MSEISKLIYEVGRPIQYSYLKEELPLWAFQTPFAHRPWAVEPPSAGLMFSFELLNALERRQIELASLTHGAGLSSTGDPRVDVRLPLSERFEIPERTVRAIEVTKARGGRVIGVGTTVARALEGAVQRGGGRLIPGRGRTNLRIGPHTRLQVIDGLVTGMHLPGESHFEILRALAPESLLQRAHEHAAEAGYLAHELGDCTLVV